MSKWIFIEDIPGLRHPVKMAVNLECIATIAPRNEDAELVVFFSKAHIDPHVLQFKTKELCQAAYEGLKQELATQD